MFRPSLTVAAALLLSAWAGAQNPAARPTAAERLRMLQADRLLLDNLVTNGIDLAAADTAADRARAASRTARALAAAVREAADDKDPDRVAELGGHFDTMVRDGLAPNVDEARRVTPPDSPDALKIKGVVLDALAEVDAVRLALPPGGKVGDNARVRVRLQKLDELRERLK